MSENKIPKIIHYCWFGGKPLPESAIKCINSWKKHMPDYEIKRWDESNYDINKNQYMKEAYEAKKYGFVPDYARFDILYQYGGLYFDTDVEIIRPLNDIVERGPFMGLESGTTKHLVKKRKLRGVYIAPGLGIGGPSKFPLFKKCLSLYDNRHFIKENGSYDLTTSLQIFAKNISFNHIEMVENNIACCDGLYIYPKDYFCPLNYITRRIKITDNTKTIHWYDATWLPKWIRNLNKFLTKPSYKKYERFINNQK